jgi:hypothetical protein
MPYPIRAMERTAPAPAEEILTLQEVAADLRCSKSQVSNLVKGRIQGVPPLPSIPLGRRLLVRRRALEDWKRQSERIPDGVMLGSAPKPNAVDA